MKSFSSKTLFYALFFGVLSGFIIAFALSVFIPQFFTDWAGSLVCSGQIKFVTFKQAFYCYTSPNDSVALGDAMFWAVFKRFILPGIALGLVLTFGFINVTKFLWERRAAAGF